MRVIGGSAKGKNLLSVPGDTTRPILDRVKAPLFDILRPRLSGARMLDMFAGTGQVGIEALSQGAAHCIFLDLTKVATETIKRNLEITGLTAQAEVRQTDAFAYVRNTSKQFDIIYIAPPQFESLWIQAMQTIAERPEILKPDGRIVVQIDPKEYESLTLSAFEEFERRKYGNTELIFYYGKNG